MTAEGWGKWFPVEPGDVMLTQQPMPSELGQGLLDIDRPDPARRHAVLEAADPADDYALAEREVIQEESR